MPLPAELTDNLPLFIEHYYHQLKRMNSGRDPRLHLDEIYFRVFRDRPAGKEDDPSDVRLLLIKKRKQTLQRAINVAVRRGQIEVYYIKIAGCRRRCYRPFDVLAKLAEVPDDQK